MARLVREDLTTSQASARAGFGNVATCASTNVCLCAILNVALCSGLCASMPPRCLDEILPS